MSRRRCCATVTSTRSDMPAQTDATLIFGVTEIAEWLREERECDTYETSNEQKEN